MRKPFVVLVCLLFVSAFLAGASAQSKPISPSDTFTIPTFNSQIRFATNLTYTSANLENNTWFFTGLYGSGKAGYPIHDNLHISAENCTVVVFYIQSWPQPESHYSSTDMQWIKYDVVGKGTQTLDGNDLFPNSVNYTQWTVKINGQTKPMGDDWSYSPSKQLIITTSGQQSTVEVSVYHVPVGSDLAPLPSPEPALKNFSSTDYFPIPNNGSINFAVAGSFDKASLDNDTWNFVNLTLSNYAINAGIFAPNVTGRNVLPYVLKCGYPANLGVSVLDSNVTIIGISPLTWESYIPRIKLRSERRWKSNFHFSISTISLQLDCQYRW